MSVRMRRIAISATIEISYGELIDRITILEIKNARIKDPAKLKNIQLELDQLSATSVANIRQSTDVEDLTQQLRDTNEQLWVIEDNIRRKEHLKEYDEEFVGYARNVYLYNDRRARIKRQLNEYLGSRIMEEKSYQDY